MRTELVIIGAGPAGMAAALSARENGIKDILILERDGELGGILNQCIHNGFGLHMFQEELTGPEYAARYVKQIKEAGIPYFLNTMVMDMKGGTPCRITAIGKEKGLLEIEAKAVILAMGCRERPRGAMNVPGSRPAGIYSAGTAQYIVNRKGILPGKEVVILGSGDIGLIMARRMTLQGARVKLVAEIMPYSGGLKRNIVQCLDDFDIPLKLSHTVTKIHGKKRVEGVTVAKVDENLIPIKETEEYFSCDTVLFSCGLIPENELTEKAGAQIDAVTKGPVVNGRLETTAEGIFACGNVLHVHDLADNVSKEAADAGRYAAAYIKEKPKSWGEVVRPPIPQKSKCVIPEGRDASKTIICIGCPAGCFITIGEDGGNLIITGNSCAKGEAYARNEVTSPRRMVTSFVKVTGGELPLVPVKTAREIPKEKVMQCMEEIRRCTCTAQVLVGDVLIENIAETGVSLLATGNVKKQ